MVTPRVLGIDPSLSATGLAWGDRSVATTGGAGDQRLWVIHRTVLSLATGVDSLDDRGEPYDLAVVEGIMEGGTGSARTGMAHGVVRLALLHAAVPYMTVPAASVKMYATGKGNATKPDMRVSLLQRFGMDLRDPDQVDAWWLRALGMDMLGAPVLTLPQAHRRALDKLTLPVPA